MYYPTLRDDEPDRRYMLQSGEDVTEYTDYPIADRRARDRIFLHQITRLSPDRTKMAAGSGMGLFLEFFDVGGDIRQRGARYLFETFFQEDGAYDLAKS